MVGSNEGPISRQNEMAGHVSSHLGVDLNPLGKNLFESEDGGIKVVCLWSKVYGQPPRELYWFGFNPR